MHALGLVDANPMMPRRAGPPEVSTMHTIAQFKAFLEAVLPVCQAIQDKLLPLGRALGPLNRLGDAIWNDDAHEVIKGRLATYGNAIREAGGRLASKRFKLDLIEAEYQPENADLCRQLLIGAVEDQWSTFEDLTTNYPEFIQAQVLDCLHNLAWSTNRQVENRLISDQVDTISQQLAQHDLTPWLAIDGRSDIPPYLAELLKLIQDRELAQAGRPGQPGSNTPIPEPAANPLAQPASPQATPPVKQKRNVNARMLETLTINTEAAGWTCRKWKEHLKCAPSSVASTATWKRLLIQREQRRLEKRADRRGRNIRTGNRTS